MEICNVQHTPAFKIKYRNVRGSTHQPEWLVCARCHEKRYFGTLEEIVSIEPV